MAQYQKWRHYQGIDRQRRAELEVLEAELAQLQQQVLPTDEPNIQDLQVNNEIIRALLLTAASSLSAPAHVAETPSLYHVQQTQYPPPQPSFQHEPIPDTSSAFFAQNRLPNLETRLAENQQPQFPDNTTLPPVPHSEMPLLPEDMGAFFAANAQTEPQVELPWWLRNITRTSRTPGTSATNGLEGPVDKESLRTNRLVQRWFERWGKQVPQQQKEQE